MVLILLEILFTEELNERLRVYPALTGSKSPLEGLREIEEV